jgi:hypothetical protein
MKCHILTWFLPQNAGSTSGSKCCKECGPVFKSVSTISSSIKNFTVQCLMTNNAAEHHRTVRSHIHNVLADSSHCASLRDKFLPQSVLTFVDFLHLQEQIFFPSKWLQKEFSIPRIKNNCTVIMIHLHSSTASTITSKWLCSQFQFFRQNC